MRNIFVSAYTSLPSPAVAVHIERKIFGVSSLSYLSLSQRDPINVWRARNTDFAHSYLRFGACYVDENTTIRFSETISPNSYR